MRKYPIYMPGTNTFLLVGTVVLTLAWFPDTLFGE